MIEKNNQELLLQVNIYINEFKKLKDYKKNPDNFKFVEEIESLQNIDEKIINKIDIYSLCSFLDRSIRILSSDLINTPKENLKRLIREKSRYFFKGELEGNLNIDDVSYISGLKENLSYLINFEDFLLVGDSKNTQLIKEFFEKNFGITFLYSLGDIYKTNYSHYLIDAKEFSFLMKELCKFQYSGHLTLTNQEIFIEPFNMNKKERYFEFKIKLSDKIYKEVSINKKN